MHRDILKTTKNEQEVFLKAVKDAVPLRRLTNKTKQKKQKPKPIPFQKILDENEALNESQLSDFTPETLLDSDDQLSFARNGISIKIIKKLRRGFWTIQNELDLHGYRIYEARELTYRFLKSCIKEDKRCVRIIHGKGLRSIGKEPVLKIHTKSWLRQSEEVLAFCQAPGYLGGAGAVLVLLKAHSHHSHQYEYE